MSPATPASPAAPALRCRGLRKRFGSTVAVDGIDLEVAAGEIVGLLGPNGAGKTTTIRILTTLIPADEGTIEVFGHDVAAEPFTTRRLIGYVPQQLSADATLTGRENIELFTRLFDVPRRERRARVDDVLEAMRLTDAADRLAKTYSGGMIRRLELAQALVNQPHLLVLDEPTIGLDPIGRDSVWERIDALRAAHVDDRAAHDPLHGGGRRGLRPRRAHAPRARAGARLAAGAAARARPGRHARGRLPPPHRRRLRREGGELRDVRSTRRTAGRLG